ncbi:triacylglycerol lipase, partial [Teladorsagia circumcincta]
MHLCNLYCDLEWKLNVWNTPKGLITVELVTFTFRQEAPMRAAMEDLANLVSSFFADIDVVFSDVAAGLFLLAHSPANVYPPIVPASSMKEEDSKLFEDQIRDTLGGAGGKSFMNLKDNGDMAMHSIRSRRDPQVDRSELSKPSVEVLIIEDNCCFCNTAAFTLATEEKNVDLFFVSFRNGLYEVPFVVLADHETRSIVITIRGSCSLVDLVTDLCLDDEVLSIDVDADPLLRTDTTLDAEGEVRVHRGMLMSARYVFDTLRKHQVLEDLAVLNTNYQLVVCGHSLGAGVASLLTLLLKQEYPDVRCFAFAPPGCVISENGIREMEQHVMSIVSGDDVVSRISFH